MHNHGSHELANLGDVTGLGSVNGHGTAHRASAFRPPEIVARCRLVDPNPANFIEAHLVVNFRLAEHTGVKRRVRHVPYLV